MTGPSGAQRLDPRLAAFRPDLADRRLEGRVTAARFVEGAPMRVTAPLAPFRSRPDSAASVTATKLMGEPLRVFERAAGWAWAQSDQDGYVGYVPEDLLGDGHRPGLRAVALPRAHLYPAPDLKRPPLGWAPMEARLDLAEPREESARFVKLDSGAWIYAAHLRPVAEPAADWVAVAEMFLGAPYLWGGDSVEGIDCSGLMRVALQAAGRACPRDSDMQEAALGAPVDADAPLMRGDVVFWRGHVGVMRDADILLHANAWTMSVASEPLAEARRRIAAMAGGAVTAIRRLDA